MSDDLVNTLKPYTKYVCPVDRGEMWHGSLWTGAYCKPRPNDCFCPCGERYVEEVPPPDDAVVIQEQADEIKRLQGFIYGLGISVMHPDMGGAHQCTINANCKRLTSEQWAVVLDCQEAQEADGE